MSEKVIAALNHVLADTYTLYLKTQNYHWNVTGPSFSSLHGLFEEQYTDLAVAVDDVAERIRALGAPAPGSFTEFLEMTGIAEAKSNIKADEMVKELANDQTHMIESLNKGLSAAQEVEDEVTIGMMIDRMTVHEKARWMLNASI